VGIPGSGLIRPLPLNRLPPMSQNRFKRPGAKRTAAQRESEAWQAWERSKLAAESTTTETVTIGKRKAKLQGQKTTKTRKGQVGDAGFLSRILDCIGKRCEILGLDAPAKQEISGTVATAGVVIELPANGRDEPDLSRLNTLELAVLCELTDKAAGGSVDAIGRWVDYKPGTHSDTPALMAALAQGKTPGGYFASPELRTLAGEPAVLPDGSQSNAQGDSRCVATTTETPIK
jgi:hypothetical protein